VSLSFANVAFDEFSILDQSHRQKVAFGHDLQACKFIGYECNRTVTKKNHKIWAHGFENYFEKLFFELQLLNEKLIFFKGF